MSHSPSLARLRRRGGRRTLCGALLCATGALAACNSSNSNSPPALAGVVVTAPTNTIAVGATVQLTATTVDGSGAAITGHAITWSSGSSSVASVSSTGLVQGLTPGSSTIIANSEGFTGQQTITVTPH